MSSYSLTHLKQLEAESIHIIREVASEFNNPVMLYSVGKDSSVMVQLALKAFYPAKPPFPLMHVDTTWKFSEMITFREQYVRKEITHKKAVDRFYEEVYPASNRTCETWIAAIKPRVEETVERINALIAMSEKTAK